MTWVKLDDAFFRNPKVTSVKPLARLLYVASLCHCADTLSDGEIRERDLPALHLQAGSAPKNVAELTQSGLWIEEETSYWIPDFLAYNPSRKTVLDQREAGKVRANRSRTNREASRERAPLVRATPTPTPTPSKSSSVYENNAVHEPTVQDMPTDAVKWAELRQKHFGPRPLKEAQ